MYKVAIVINGIVDSIGEYERIPVVSPMLTVVDISDYEGPVQKGYIYDSTSGEFTESNNEVPEVPVVPESEIPESTDQKLERLLEQLAMRQKQDEIQQQQNLILVDINLTVYEELLKMKDQLALVNGATDNA